MLNRRDFILLFSVYAGIVLGILFPRFFSIFQSFPIYCVMGLLLLSYLPIGIARFMGNLRGSLRMLVTLSVLKLVIVPVLVWFVFRLILPDFATAALLLTSVSVGVTAPFIAGLVNANVALVLTMVVISSLLIPFTMPLLIQLLLGRSVAISFAEMVRTLAAIVFIPVLIAEILKRTTPGMTLWLIRRNYGLSVLLFAITNLGVFSKYAGFFHREPSVILLSIGVALFLAVLYFLTGILAAVSRPVEERITGAVVFVNINNILVVVFAAHFFGAVETAVAAMYNIPFFGMIFLMRAYQNLAPKGRG